MPIFTRGFSGKDRQSDWTPDALAEDTYFEEPTLAKDQRAMTGGKFEKLDLPLQTSYAQAAQAAVARRRERATAGRRHARRPPTQKEKLVFCRSMRGWRRPGEQGARPGGQVEDGSEAHKVVLPALCRPTSVSSISCLKNKLPR